MKYCDEYAALLDAFVDGECSGEEAERVRAHLTQCDGCRNYVAMALAARDAFPSAEETRVPDGFAEGVMAAVRAHAAPRKSRKRWVGTLVSVAACAAIMVAAGRQLSFSGSSAADGAQDSLSARTPAAAAYTAPPESGSAPQSVEGDSEFTPSDESGAALPLQPRSFQSTAASGYRKWACLTADQVGNALGSYVGAERTDEATGQHYTLYELGAEEFDSVIDAVDGREAVTENDSAADSLYGIAVYSD